MKKLINVLLVVSSILVASTAYSWECSASSNTGAWGVGQSYSRSQARSIAMHECRMRTPSWGTCWIDYCW